LSAGVGCSLLGILGLAADASKPVAKLLTFYLPTGPLSGVSSLAILLWLVTWFILAKRWRNRTVAIAKVNATAFLLLALGILLTFPPFADLLQGK
jgi:asparagine N-glycosylation enzyme membrane subunit Stt3